MKKTLLAAILAVSVAGTALAANQASKQGIVLGADAGFAVIQTPDKSLYDPNEITSGSLSFDTGSFAYGAHIGYDFALTNSFLLGPELGYYNNGYSKYTGSFTNVFSDTTKVKSQDVDLLAKATYFFGSSWNVFAKGGVAWVDQHFDSVTGFGSTVASASKSLHKYEPEVGLGVGYEFATGFALNLNAKHIFGKNPSSIMADSNRANKLYGVYAIMAGMSYRFAV